MDNQKLIHQAINKMHKHTKDLKQRAMINQPQTMNSEFDSNFDSAYSSSNSSAFFKTKSKVQSMLELKQSSPIYSKSRPASRQKSELNMSCKISFPKKDVSSQNEKEKFLTKYSKNEVKHLTNLLNGSMGFRDVPLKKAAHSHTYTHINDRDSDKYSQIQNSFDVVSKISSKLGNSKSPHREVKKQSNSTIYIEDSRGTNFNRAQVRPKTVSETKTQMRQVEYLVVQIKRLEEIIQKYKTFILSLKHKYKQIQEQLKQKIMSEHYIDVLKERIYDLEDKNHELNLIINKQKTDIYKYQEKFIEKIIKLGEHYSKILKQNITLAHQNSFFKQILLISSQNLQSKVQNEKIEIPIENNLDKNQFYRTMCKNLQQFESKWK